MAYHSEQEVDETSFADKEEYYKYMENKKYSTLNDIEVKSIAERDISNVLFLHNIEFNYEPLVEWVDSSTEEKNEDNENEDNNNDKVYHPDFYLPEYDIYIEHWGLNGKKSIKDTDWEVLSTRTRIELENMQVLILSRKRT